MTIDTEKQAHHGEPMADQNVQPAAVEHGADDEHHQAVEAAWLRAEANHSALLRMFGGQKEVVLSEQHAEFPVFVEHVVTQNNVLEVGCIDERCGHQHEGFHLGLGGAGVLVPIELKAKYVSYIVDKAQADNVEKIQIDAHQSCGAAKIAVESAGSDIPVDTFAQDFTEKLAEKVKAEVAQRGLQITVEHGYLTDEDMLPPTKQGLHNAVGISYDTTGKFDPTRRSVNEGDDLPPLFNIDGSFQLQHALDNVEVSRMIAFGGHGFAGKFTQDRPFVIVVVRDSSDEASIKKAQEAVADLEKYLETRPEAAEGRMVLKIVDVGVAIAKTEAKSA